MRLIDSKGQVDYNKSARSLADRVGYHIFLFLEFGFFI
jgi:hypothetical protein